MDNIATKFGGHWTKISVAFMQDDMEKSYKVFENAIAEARSSTLKEVLEMMDEEIARLDSSYSKNPNYTTKMMIATADNLKQKIQQLEKV